MFSDIRVIFNNAGQLLVKPDKVQAVPSQLSDKPEQMKPCRVRVFAISWEKTDTNR